MADTARRRARELVLKALYAESVGGRDPDEIVSAIIAAGSLSKRAYEFARALFLLVCQHRQWADEVISSLAENWDIERIALVDRSIMQMALVELREMPDVPVKVTLNEAIELAKEYSTGESAAFINGILDSFVKSSPQGPAG
ncbi:MAG TPA: transcription antitermination factor NusB [Acidobacteriota bacterium]|nr:transcription antitermination factor NusB [Acidobacteriota bacterium]